VKPYYRIPLDSPDALNEQLTLEGKKVIPVIDKKINNQFDVHVHNKSRIC